MSRSWLAGTVSVLEAALFVVLVLPYLGTLAHDYDEAWMMLDARAMARGLRPYVDFPHHEMPLHLYLLAGAGRLFGNTLVGYRVPSLVSVVGTGLLVYRLVRPFAGPLAALVAQAVFLFSSVHALSLLVALHFGALDFVSARYFVPVPAIAAWLVAGWVWLAERRIPRGPIALAAGVVAIVLATQLETAVRTNRDAWYWGRIAWIAEAAPRVLSFSPIFFVASGTDPGCGFANPALTYGRFGEVFLTTERARRFRFTDERLIACLRADPAMPVVVDWSFYYFTRPGSALRAYLEGEGREQRLFFSPEAMAQWGAPVPRVSFFR